MLDLQCDVGLKWFMDHCVFMFLIKQLKKSVVDVSICTFKNL